MEPMSVNDMIADARTRIKGLSMEEMQRELEAGEALIVDREMGFSPPQATPFQQQR